METDLIDLKNIGILLEMDQLCISTLLSVYKDLFKVDLDRNEKIFGSVLICCKFCGNFRKTRDIVNAIYCVREKKVCERMKSYLKRKTLMLEAEIKVMGWFKFDLGKFKIGEYYSLLFCLFASLKAENEVILKGFTYLNESFLCSNLTTDDYPEVVASCITLAYNKELNSQDHLNIITESWYTSHYFDSTKVLSYTETLKKHLESQVKS